MRAFVASDDPSLSYELRDALARLGQECPASQVVSLDAAGSRLFSASGASSQETEPDLLLVAISSDVERAVSVLQQMRRRTQNPIIAVGPVTDPKLVLRMIREGAHEYLDQADVFNELKAALDRLKAGNAGRHSTGRVIALLPASGGCGSSTLAASLAAAIANTTKNCILLDLNSEFGDLAPLLDLKPTHTLAELCRSVTRLDRDFVEGALVTHSSGIKLLPAPPRIIDASQVTVDGVRRIISLCTELAPFVVVDLPHSIRPEAMQALSQSNTILLVLRLDFTSLRNARRVFDYLQEAGQSLERVQIVVNRYRQPGEVPVSDAEAALGIKIKHFVLDDPKSINRMNNNGTPIVFQTPSAKVSRQIAALASHLQQTVDES